MCSFFFFFCNFTFLLANNFHITNTAIEMKLNGVMTKKNEGFPELSRNRLKWCQMCFLRNFSLCDAENCLQVMSSELFSWQAICWTGTMGLIIACTSWWWNILAFFGKKCVFLLCGDKRGSWTSVSGQKPWNIKNLSESLSHSWLSPICAQRTVAAGRDQGTNCWKYLTSASDGEKKDGEMTDRCGQKEPSRVLQGGVTEALHNWHSGSPRRTLSLWLVVGTLMFDVVKSWKVVLGQY